MLRASGLTKFYNGEPALEDLNLSVKTGEIYCLLGANGAGKTTTIKLFLGFISPTRGHAQVGDIDPAIDPMGARRLLAYIPEQVSLYNHMSALENLAFFAELSGQRVEEGAHREQLGALLLRVGLSEESFDWRLSRFSKGMRQKVGVAIALARRARALLLDEPMSGLDPLSAATFSRLLCELRDEGAAILITTHDLYRARDMGTRIGLMRSGHLVAEFECADLTHRQLEDAYLSHIGAEEP